MKNVDGPEIVDGLEVVRRGGLGEASERSEHAEQVSYADLGLEIGQLVESKQQAYGDSFGRSGNVLRVLYPDGIKLEQYDDALAIVRIVDKLFRVASHGANDLHGESPGRDIAGYGLLMAARHERK